MTQEIKFDFKSIFNTQCYFSVTLFCDKQQIIETNSVFRCFKNLWFSFHFCGRSYMGHKLIDISFFATFCSIMQYQAFLWICMSMWGFGFIVDFVLEKVNTFLRTPAFHLQLGTFFFFKKYTFSCCLGFQYCTFTKCFFWFDPVLNEVSKFSSLVRWTKLLCKPL